MVRNNQFNKYPYHTFTLSAKEKMKVSQAAPFNGRMIIYQNNQCICMFLMNEKTHVHILPRNGKDKTPLYSG